MSGLLSKASAHLDLNCEAASMSVCKKVLGRFWLIDSCDNEERLIFEES
jgi:hypothetical protein